MLFILAKTEWPSLGELIGEYLFTPGYALYTPNLSAFAYVFLSIIISCYLFAHFPNMPATEDFEVRIYEVYLYTRTISALIIPYIIESENLSLLAILFIAVFIVDSIWLCKTLGSTLEDLILFLIASTAASFLCAYCTYTWGVFCILAFIVCILTGVWLIKYDKLYILEKSWPLVLFLWPALFGDD